MLAFSQGGFRSLGQGALAFAQHRLRNLQMVGLPASVSGTRLAPLRARSDPILCLRLWRRPSVGARSLPNARRRRPSGPSAHTVLIDDGRCVVGLHSLRVVGPPHLLRVRPMRTQHVLGAVCCFRDLLGTLRGCWSANHFRASSQRNSCMRLGAICVVGFAGRCLQQWADHWGPHAGIHKPSSRHRLCSCWVSADEESRKLEPRARHRLRYQWPSRRMRHCGSVLDMLGDERLSWHVGRSPPPHRSQACCV